MPILGWLLGLGVPVVSLTTQVEAMFCTYIALSTRDFFFFFKEKKEKEKLSPFSLVSQTRKTLVDLLAGSP